MPDEWDSEKNSGNSDESFPKDEVDQLKKELGKANEKIEKMEEKLEDQNIKSASLKHYKSEGLTLGLSIGIGLLGIMGVGHMYVGRIKRGIIILIIGIIAEIGIYFSIGFSFIPISYADTWDIAGPMIAIIAVSGIAGFAFFIWQIINARKLCREYNEYFEEKGKAPW